MTAAFLSVLSSDLSQRVTWGTDVTGLLLVVSFDSPVTTSVIVQAGELLLARII